MSQYRRRNQSNPERIMAQITDGKLGELFACKYLKNKGFKCTDPDFEIYASRNKSFDADLFSNEQPIHVKTQNITSANKYGSSWVFQAGGVGFGNRDPCLDESQDDWCVFVTVDHEKQSATVFGPFNINDVRPHMKDPKLEHLKGIKKCIYLEDIVNLKPLTAPIVPLKHDDVMECLSQCLQTWMDSGFFMECDLEGDQLATALKNEWVYEDDGLNLYNVQNMIDTALGKIPLDEYKVEFSKKGGLPDEYRWTYENSDSDSDTESEPEEPEELIVGEDEQPDAHVGGGFDDDYDCPYDICGGSWAFDSSSGLGANHCVCCYDYDDIDSNAYCSMSPGGRYDITQEQVDRWNEVVDNVIEAKKSGLTYRQFWCDRKKQALRAKKKAVRDTIYQPEEPEEPEEEPPRKKTKME